ncbi:MAG: hypothetical protein MZV63_58040 [Marinilabiliales bacterium]|nr:hypothetical protein [Marinilabiliales bacterium]
MIYTYNGKTININLGKLSGSQVKAGWYNPRDGGETEIGTFPNSGTRNLILPGSADGKDWVLALDAVKEELIPEANHVSDSSFLISCSLFLVKYNFSAPDVEAKCICPDLIPEFYRLSTTTGCPGFLLPFH